MELQQLDDRLGRRRDELWPAIREEAHVEGVHTFDVLLTRDVIDEVRLVELAGKRREQKHAMRRRVAARSFERRDEDALGRVARERNIRDGDPEPLPARYEALDIGVRRRIGTHRDRGEAWRDPAGLQGGAARGGLGVERFGEGLAVKESHACARRTTGRSAIRRSR